MVNSTQIRLTAAAAALGLSVLLSGCSQGPEIAVAAAHAAGPAAAAVKTVGVVPVTQGDVSRTITQPATIQGGEEAVLYARAAGYLKSISVDKGDRVRAGQVLAVIESPELMHNRDQARASFQQAKASTLGVEASKGRAQADADQAGASVERAKADARQADAVIARAKADQARAEAQLPKLRSLIEEAEANIQHAVEQQAQAQSDVQRYQQQLKGAQASLRAAEASLARAESEARLQQLTYNRLKAVQDKDNGLIAGQDVDIARTRMEAAKADVDSARSKLEAAKQDAGAVEQQIESARRSAAAAARKVDAAKSRAQATKEEVRVAQREVETAREQVKVTEAQAESAKRQVDVAQAQHRAFGAQVKVTDAQIAASRQQADGTRSALAAASSMAGYTRIIAPYTGVITERLADPGAFVQNASANQASARGIVKLVKDGGLRIMIPVPEMDLPYVRRGERATVLVDAYPKQPFPGAVTRFAGAVDPKSRTMLTEIDVANPGGRLKPGMYARVTLTLETRHGALSVPSEAVMGKDDDRFVYIVTEGKARKTAVKVGIDDGKMAEVTEGLTAASQVVLVGRDTLVDGAAVKAEPAKLEPAKK